MCGRYTLKTDRSKIEEHFGLENVPAFEPRFNLAPTQDGLVVRPGKEPGTRTAAMLRWGLIPSWAKERANLPLMINARCESAASRPAFRDAFKRRRCIIVTDGFYEWSKHGTKKMPYRFTVGDEELFGMAGLWDRWCPPGTDADETLETFTVITTVANDVLAPYHDRMPVILPRELYDDWMNPLLSDRETLQRMLMPFSSMHMAAHAVSPKVNNIKNDDPTCLEPPPAEDESADREQGQLGLDLG